MSAIDILFINIFMRFCTFNGKAKQMPHTTKKLRHLIKSKHPYVERNLGSVVNIIRRCVENASSFEAAAQQLKDGRLKMVCLSW